MKKLLLFLATITLISCSSNTPNNVEKLNSTLTEYGYHPTNLIITEVKKDEVSAEFFDSTFGTIFYINFTNSNFVVYEN
jgi:uncharacterized protein YcfL